jgi:WhiB family transcriptional regulator, redox-sensing transcriptional regulator
MATMIGDNGHASWMSDGACRDADPELFFPVSEGEASVGQARQATSICRRCGVEAECLRYSLSNGIKEGIWGGHTEQERIAMLRNRAERRMTERRRVHGGQRRL